MTSLYKNLEACKGCKLSQDPGQVVRGLGYLDPRVLVLGEAPGATESAQGKPFVGKSGKLLQHLLGQAGYTMDELYITNVVKHRPPDNRDPLPEEILACGAHLKTEIQIVNPKVIVCVGRIPALALHLHQGKTLPKGSLRGYTFAYEERQVICTWHPAYILRNMSKASELVTDLTTARDIARACTGGNDG